MESVESVGAPVEERALAAPWGRVASWAGRVRSDVVSADTQTKAYWGALALALVLGAFLRLNGYVIHAPSLGLDEALWAPRFVQWPWEKLGIRPIGFVWLTRQLVNWFEPSEFWFRFVPNMGGLLALGLMPYVASRLFESRALRVALVLLFALHPGLVDLSKEFKPYSFEVLVHLLTVVLYLRYQQTRRPAYLYALLAYLPFAFLLAYNIAFALPSLLLLAAWSGLKRRSAVLIVASVLGAAVCGAVVYETNVHLLKKIEKEGETETYWGKKYDVFYRAANDGSRLRWTLGKAADTLAMTDLGRELWVDDQRLPEGLGQKLGSVDKVFWIGLGGLGIIQLLRRRRDQALLLLLPVLVLAGVNALGKWPFGQFRTNLFTCVYLLPLPVLGAELVRELIGARYERALLGLAAIPLLGGFAFTFDVQGQKRIWCQNGYSRQVIDALFELRRGDLARGGRMRPAHLVLDLFAHKPFDYYFKLHPVVSQRSAEFYRLFKVDKVASNRLTDMVNWRLRRADLVYAVASKQSSATALRRLAADDPKAVVEQRNIAPNVVVMVLDR